MKAFQNMISILKEQDAQTGEEYYDLKVYEGELMVHHMKFIAPEVAEFYADNYMLKVWGISSFSASQTMH